MGLGETRAAWCRDSRVEQVVLGYTELAKLGAARVEASTRAMTASPDSGVLPTLQGVVNVGFEGSPGSGLALGGWLAGWCSESLRVVSIVLIGLVVKERRCRRRCASIEFTHCCEGGGCGASCLCVRGRKLGGDLCRHKLSLDAKVAVYKCGRWIVRERKC